LARLGRRPRINDEIIEGVNSKHPFVRIDWEGLRQKASSWLIQPFENNSQFLRDLVAQIKDLNLDIAGLHLPVLRVTVERELVRQLIAELRLLRSVLDVKLRSSRTLAGTTDYTRKSRRE
jgi:hypothetical protein